MGWFGRKSDAAAPAPALPTWLGTRTSETFPRFYEARLKEVFVANPVGQRAVRLVAGMTGALTLDLLEGKPRAIELVRKAGFIEGIAAQLLLHGNAYVQVVPGRGSVGELFALRPERVTIETDELGWPSRYAYRVGGRTVRITARDALARKQIIHLKALNPSDDHMGLGCLDSAIAAASIHNRASQWNKGLLDNAARPSGALVYEPEDGSALTSDQFARLKSELEQHFSGGSNAGRPLLLEGGLKWQAMSLTPADMDFIRLKEAAARDIALAFGVPPALLGLPGDTAYANLREAGRALYRQTVLPLGQRIIDGLCDGLADWFGKVRIGIDVDQISEIAEDRERLWQQVSSATFLSDAEKREMVGYSARKGAA